MKSRKLVKNIKVNDIVTVISGRDKGKSGIIKRIDRVTLRVLVDGIFIVKKHLKSNVSPQGEGGIVDREAWISLSKIRKNIR